MSKVTKLGFITMLLWGLLVSVTVPMVELYAATEATTSATFPLGWSAVGDQVGAQYGYSVSSAGDVNGDGYDDVIVGAPKYDNGVDREGAAFVYHGYPSGVSETPNWIIGSQQTGARLGNSVAAAGDVNGDGFDDVIVGAYRYYDGQPAEGAIYAFHGSSSGLLTTPKWLVQSNQKDAHLGFAVASAGDVNHDGYDDVIVGARWYSDGESNEGIAQLYLGSESGLEASPSWWFQGNQPSAALGSAVSTAGDVNGDGYSDIAVAAPTYDGEQVDEGRVFVFYGSATGPSTIPDWQASGGQAGAMFGTSIHTAGDIDNDGYSDFIVGAPWYDSYVENQGVVYVFCGSADNLQADACWTAKGRQMGEKFGYSVHTAGDVNNDGFADVIIGAPGYENGQPEEGAAHVYLGTAAGLVNRAVWKTEGDKADAGLGFSVGTAGDINNDDYDDLIVGTPDYRHSEDIVGRAYVFEGEDAVPEFFVFLPLVVGDLD